MKKVFYIKQLYAGYFKELKVQHFAHNIVVFTEYFISLHKSEINCTNEFL